MRRQYKYGGMQLLKEYKQQLHPDFLSWYLDAFTNPRMGYGHWTAGLRTGNSGRYHKVVLLSRNGEARVITNEDVRVDMYSHTFGRNTNSWSISLAGMAGATTEDLGNEVPTPEQCRLFVEETALICINLRQKVANLMCHHEAADNVDQGPNPPYPTPGKYGSEAKPYGPLSDCYRWDIWVRIDPDTLRWYPPHTDGDGLLWYADWWRGETILEIQARTKHVWVNSRR